MGYICYWDFWRGVKYVNKYINKVMLDVDKCCNENKIVGW